MRGPTTIDGDERHGVEFIRRLTRSKALRIVSALVVGVFVLATIVSSFTPFPAYNIDLDVYRIGGQAWLDGVALYGEMPATEAGIRLPFTYPPIAAILFSVLAWMPLSAASAVVQVASVASLFAVIWLVAKDVSDLRGRDLAWFSMAVTALMIFLGPVRETFSFGQINIYLMLFVLVDVCVGKDKWWRGSLTGLAAAIKLTPAVFFLFFLLRKDVRAVLVGGAAFLAAHAVGFLLAPGDSVTYWTSALRDPSRIGGLAYTSNQSLNGLIHRLGLDGTLAQVVWVSLVVLLVAFSSLLMLRLMGRGQDLAAVVVVAFAGLLASPVSWSHHWVWAVPALLLLGGWLVSAPPVEGVGLRRYLAVTLYTGVAVFFVAPQWFLPHEEERELGWAWYMHLVGNFYVWWVFALYVGMWWFTRRTRPAMQS